MSDKKRVRLVRKEESIEPETVKKSRFVLVVSGTIDEEKYNVILQAINEYQQTRDDYSGLTVLITSLGGAAYIAMAIYDLIKSLNADVYTVALGGCASAATILFALGQRRFVSENVTFLIHTSRIDYASMVTMREVKYLDDTLKYTNERVIKILDELIENEEFKKRLADTFANVKEDYVSVDDLLRYGVATDKLTDIYSIF